MNRSEPDSSDSRRSGSGSGRGEASGGGSGRGGASDGGSGPRHPGAGPVLGSYPRRYGRYIGLLGVVILVLITINTALTKPNGARGIEPGYAIPPFAAPLAAGSLNGDVNDAVHANEGAAGDTPACDVRGKGVLNVCELYERGPLVLALFVDGSSCPAVLNDMQALAASFAGVSFAAVAIKGERKPLLELMRKHGLTSVQVGFDSDGILAGLYKVASCPQVSFVLPGGVVQSPALLTTPSQAKLRARVVELVAAAKARGWRRPA
jgi:hypothetical protein